MAGPMVRWHGKPATTETWWMTTDDGGSPVKWRDRQAQGVDEGDDADDNIEQRMELTESDTGEDTHQWHWIAETATTARRLGRWRNDDDR
ncbi:hypothetical protein E2562_011113 [Oryza meyeriana var. granulata]|uniref:Uncharacterized protein n=1 Tax=Oryza meyeriana var. granulata TaxID=110450 RepID=A0A6G1EWR9_9ORYZ|nr:hypothetical protein E2562_011113 [Oryza meyeriana var. granulata]